MAEVVIPAVASHHHVGIRSTVEAGERRAQPLVAVLLGELRAVDTGRVAAALRVDEEPRLTNVPLHCVYVYATLKHTSTCYANNRT